MANALSVMQVLIQMIFQGVKVEVVRVGGMNA